MSSAYIYFSALEAWFPFASVPSSSSMIALSEAISVSFRGAPDVGPPPLRDKSENLNCVMEILRCPPLGPAADTVLARGPAARASRLGEPNDWAVELE